LAAIVVENIDFRWAIDEMVITEQVLDALKLDIARNSSNLTSCCRNATSQFSYLIDSSLQVTTVVVLGVTREDETRTMEGMHLPEALTRFWLL